MTDQQTLPDFPFPREAPGRMPAEYARLRETRPVARVRIPSGGAPHVLTRYDDVRRFLAGPSASADARNENLPALGIGEREAAARSRPFIRTDPPEHTRLRRMLQAQFTVRRVEMLRESIVQRAERLVDAIERRGEGELVADYANELSTRTVLSLVGIADADPGLLHDITRISGGRESTADEVGAALARLFGMLDEQVERRLADPVDDLVSGLVRDHLAVDGAEPGADRMSRQELLSLLGITIIAGRETTTSMIACGAWEIMRDDGARAAAVAGDERMPVLVDELLRLLSVADSIPIRVSRTDQVLSGCPIRAGDGVIALLGAANHDPAVFEDPERLRLDRESPIRHLAFGHGLHHCIGHHLARVELEVGLHALFRRLPGLRPTVDAPPLNNGSATFGVHALPVAW